ncbi:MAG: PD40 domain-containing protein [Phaeodactylibacter sp.]|nr:PD40 domain-containing protein [Phaeodactylibacter sp.]MCB9299529.1 PD40 domain-containing protein [Lewinellaceae bacterium]
MQRYTSLLITLCCCLWLNPIQSQVIKDPSSVEVYRDAEAALLAGKPKEALKLFERSLKMQPNLSAARRGMAACYELLRDYPHAAEQYDAILASDSLFSRILYYEAGQAHYKSGDHTQALKYFRQFEALQAVGVDTFSLNTERELAQEADYLKKLPDNIRACEVRLDSLKFINITEVVNLGSGVNSKGDDYFPFLTNNQEQLFFTRKTDKGDEDLFESRLEDAGNWSKANPVRDINTNLDEGMCTMVRDGRHLFFTACGRAEGPGVCDIWEALMSPDGEVSEVQPLKGYINSEKWESQAVISCDGSTIYFSSKRPGGMGGTDIWYSRLQDDGSWSDPQNLGPKINTELDEEAPFITNDGRTLYFSSSGHPGMGDQDIFLSWLDEKGEWALPVNLGPPVNSAFRELGLFLTADGQTGYFASDRPEGKGKLDIYRFQLTDQLYNLPITFVEGFVIDSLLDMPVQATVRFDNRPAIKVGKDGRFFLCIPAWDTLGLRVEKTFFYPYQNDFIIPQWDNRQYYTIEILLRSKYDLPPPTPAPEPDTAYVKHKSPVLQEFAHTVFFGFDKSTMEADDMEKLDAFIKPLKGRKIQRVDIIGYADDIGTEAYNLKLSEERAKSIAVILMNNKIAVDRIYMEGRGELPGANSQENNRKVEVKIVVAEE